MKDNQIKVSVIVPAYNEEKYLDRCLKTVVNQTLEEIEIILVDDGSKDGTYDICEEYQQNYPEKVVVIHKANEGLGPARNSGIAIAKGEYIGFVDADDWVELDMYKSMYEAAKKNKSDIVVCDVRKIFVSEDREAVEVSLPNEGAKIDIGKYIKDGLNPAYSWNKLYKREIWDKYKFKKMVYEDLDIVLTILGDCNSISYIQRPFNTYYKRPDSITTSYTNIRLLDIMQAYRDAVNNANEKYRDETVFCVAKRILINIRTPGLSYYSADFIELINELMPSFESNVYIAEDEAVSKIFEYKGRNTVPKNVFYIGEKCDAQMLDQFVRNYKVMDLIPNVENDEEIKKAIETIYHTGGILVKSNIQFHIPIGGLRAEEFFIVRSNKEVLMFGAQKGSKFVHILCHSYNIEKSLDENIENTIRGYGNRKSNYIEQYEVIRCVHLE